MTPVSGLKTLVGSRAELFVIFGVIGILIVLFAPVPPALLDFLLITNISIALLILMLTFYMDRPLSFSTFPSVLLIATLFRLALNVASTRLILTDAHAGRVIDAIGSFVVSGNYVIGLVVFSILIVVQYVVVTSGAQRVAEVAARFTLDAMPGKQMSIDADLNMGLIDEAEAKVRRRDIEREANFYGAMDGASKFVKGDAIAGIIIILINIIGGLSIGMVQHGMDWGEALRTYTLLTVGDGIVTQIPALIIATGTGIIVTRAATDGQLSSEIVSQVTKYPRSLIMVSIALLVAMLLPGIPAWAAGILFCCTSGLAYLAFRKARLIAQQDVDAVAKGADESDLYSEMAVQPVELEIGSALRPLLQGEDGLFMRRIKAFRRQYAMDMGLVVPPLQLREEARRPPESYEIRFYGSRIAQGYLRAGKLLAINPGGGAAKVDGEATKDPSFGLPSLWIDEESGARAREIGMTVVDPVTVLVTHLTEVVRLHGFHLMTRKEAERLVGRVREQQASLVEELLPQILSLGDVQRVLQGLLRERVPVRNVELILETLAEHGRTVKDIETLVDRVRERLSLAICQTLVAKDGALHVITLDPKVDRALRDAARGGEGAQIAFDPTLLDRLLKNLVRQYEQMLNTSLSPVLLCPPQLRRILRKLVEHNLPQLHVISSAEIPGSATVKSFAVLDA